MSIRNVLPSDRSSILELIQRIALFSEEESVCALELLDIYLSNPAQKDYHFFCFTNAQNILEGYVCYGKVPLTDAVYDLYWIAVDTMAQHRGVGSALLNHLDDLLLTKGARMLLAETSSKVSYGNTRTFYAKNSFVEVSRIPDFYAENDDRIVFAKFYSLHERRRNSQWTALIEDPAGLGEMLPMSSGMTGIGKLETASAR